MQKLDPEGRETQEPDDGFDPAQALRVPGHTGWVDFAWAVPSLPKLRTFYAFIFLLILLASFRSATLHIFLKPSEIMFGTHMKRERKEEGKKAGCHSAPPLIIASLCSPRGSPSALPSLKTRNLTLDSAPPPPRRYHGPRTPRAASGLLASQMADPLLSGDLLF